MLLDGKAPRRVGDQTEKVFSPVPQDVKAEPEGIFLNAAIRTETASIIKVEHLSYVTRNAVTRAGRRLWGWKGDFVGIIGATGSGK